MKIANLHEYSTGARMYVSLLYLFGLRYDIPFRFPLLTHDVVVTFLFLMRELHAILSHSPTFTLRLYDIGRVDRDTCVRTAVSGIILRSAGEMVDARIFGYALYSTLRFPVAIAGRGDCLDRYFVRMAELQQSTAIIVHVLTFLPFTLSG